MLQMAVVSIIATSFPEPLERRPWERGEKEPEVKDGASFCYCAYVLRISRY